MKLHHALALLAALLVSVAVQLVHSQPADGANILANPSFEDGASGAFPSGWTQEDHLRSRGTATVESRPEGGRALKLSPNGRNRDANAPYGVAQAIRAGGLAGRRIRVEAAIRAAGSEPVLLVLPMSSKNRQLSVFDVRPAAGSEEFQTVSRELDLDRQTTYLIVACVVLGTRGEAWFDEVFVGTAEAPSSSTPAENRPLTASIEVDATRVLRSVPRELFGANVEWIYDANGLWDAGGNRINPAVVKAVKEAGLGPVRFPGGVFADFYHWRDGIGPRSARPRRPHGSDPNVSANSFGTDELMTFCRLTGTEPMLQVNIITGTSKEAADWVAYCNSPNHPERTKNGSPEPYKVRYWEIGNESYIRGDSPATRKAYLTPQQYAERFLEFAQAMKRVDPTVQVGAIGGRNFGKYGFVTDQSWNRIVLERAGAAIDFFAVHNAYAPVGASQAKRSVEDTYRAMFAFPRQVENDLLNLEKQIAASTKAEDAKRIRIAVTEWGPYFHVIPSDPFLDHTKTLGSAIYVAETLQALLRSPKTHIANFFKLTDVAWLGWIGMDGLPKPSLSALQLYSRHFGTRLIQTSVQSPTYDSPEVGMVAQEPGVPYVSSVSSLSEDGSRLFILAVTKSFSDASQVEVTIRGFNPRPSAIARVLTAPSVDAHNGHKLPEIPGVRWGAPARASRNSMFDKGRPGTVVIRDSELAAPGATFTLSLPPLSVTAIELLKK